MYEAEWTGHKMISICSVICFSSFFCSMGFNDRSDFDAVIQAQMDFTREAFNLQRSLELDFYLCFKGM